VRLSQVWRVGIGFLAVLFVVLVSADFYIVHTLRRQATDAGFDRLATVAQFAAAHPPPGGDATAQKIWLSKWRVVEFTPPC